jgi:hypothetical protein
LIIHRTMLLVYLAGFVLRSWARRAWVFDYQLWSRKVTVIDDDILCKLRPALPCPPL